jgi:MFS transporter, OFA family, oxalate/formate antiporter
MLSNRWFQLCASLVAMVMIANLQYSWALFVKPLQEAQGWKLSDIGWAFTLFILFQTWIQPLEGWLIDRTGPQLFISLAGVLCGAGWAGLGLVDSLPGLYMCYAVAGIGAALVYSGSMGSALKWFRDRRGLASGIMAAGFGGGTALFIPTIAWTIKYRGYQAAFLWTGVFQGIVILIVAQLLRHPKAETSAAPAKSAPAIGSHHFTTVEMLRSPHFYVLYVAFVLIATGGLIVTAQAGAIAQDFGLSTAALTLAVSLNPIANAASRIFWGWASDRLGRENTMALAFTLQAVCLLLVLSFGRQSPGWFAASLVLVYFTWGEVFSLFPATLGDYFGSRHATSNYSVLYTAKGVASIIAGGIAALLYEHFGSWSAAFLGSAAFAIIAAALALVLRSGASSLKAVRPVSLKA